MHKKYIDQLKIAHLNAQNALFYNELFLSKNVGKMVKDRKNISFDLLKDYFFYKWAENLLVLQTYIRKLWGGL